jgi:hypothetical protein
MGRSNTRLTALEVDRLKAAGMRRCRRQTKKAAIEAAATEFKIDAKRLIAVPRV